MTDVIKADNSILHSIIDGVNDAIDSFCLDHGYSNPIDMSMSVWNSLLLYIRGSVFKDGILKSYEVSQEYNYKLVSDICDYYIYICYMYEKEVSIKGFEKFTGIDDNTIRRTGSGKIASSKDWNIREKLTSENEESLSNVLYTGRKNPVGIIAILNHRHNWQTAAAARGEQKPVLTADQLPDLSLSGGQKREFLPDTATSDERTTNGG